MLVLGAVSLAACDSPPDQSGEGALPESSYGDAERLKEQGFVAFFDNTGSTGAIVGLRENGEEAFRLYGGPGYYVKAAVAPEATGIAALRCRSQFEDVRPDEECDIDIFDFRYGLRHNLGMTGQAPASSQLSFPTDDLVSVQDRGLLLDPSGVMRDSWTVLHPRVRREEEVFGAVETYLAAMYEGRTEFGIAENVGWFYEHGGPRKLLLKGVHDARAEWWGTRNAVVYGRRGEDYEPFLVLIDLETEEKTEVAVSGNVTSLALAPAGDMLAFTEFMGDSQQKRLVVIDSSGLAVLTYPGWPLQRGELGWSKDSSRIRGVQSDASGAARAYEIDLYGKARSLDFGHQGKVLWPEGAKHQRERMLLWRDGCLFQSSFSDDQPQKERFCVDASYEPFAWSPAARSP